jgi:transketolase
MRVNFAKQLYEIMKNDKNVILITADLGYFYLDEIKEKLPDQFFNCMAAEQVMIGTAIGMSLSGKIVVTYTITPFYFRCFEGIRLYVDHEKIPVKMVGSGRNQDYSDAGFSHDASDHEILKQFKNIDFIVPEGDFDLKEIIYSGRPAYLNLSR